MRKSETKGQGRFNFTESALNLVLFTLCFFIFLSSPVRQVADSSYSLLLSQSLIDHRSFELSHYAIPRLEPIAQWTGYVSNGRIYQLELVGENIYYYFPPGSSVLSIPYVFVMNGFGVSAVGEDGSYNPVGEVKLEAGLAALLMAGLTVIFFHIARMLLPLSWSLIVALGGAFGTQIWSTASRALWSDTWSIFLLGVIVLLLVAYEVKGRRLNPVLLASLLAWTYFVRPTNAISIALVSIYVLLYCRRIFALYALTGIAWLCLFVLYSWYHYERLLPSYYQANRLTFLRFWEALAGNLVSPSRGLFVFVPVTLFVLYLFLCYRRRVEHRRLAAIAVCCVTVHLIFVSGFAAWYGGFCYGPRYMTGIVPWLMLLAMLSVKAWLQAVAEETSAGRGWRWNAQATLGALLLALSILINARGATAEATWKWNYQPLDIDNHSERVWDWRRPQFLAGWLPPQRPKEFPPAMNGVRINFGLPEADKFAWYGWSAGEMSARWSDGDEAEIAFAVVDVSDYVVRIKLNGFVVPGKHPAQRVFVKLNDRLLETLTLTDDVARVYTLTAPRDSMRRENVLRFELPDAVSPQDLQLSFDGRALGIRLEWIEIAASPNAYQSLHTLRQSDPYDDSHAARISLLKEFSWNL